MYITKQNYLTSLNITTFLKRPPTKDDYMLLDTVNDYYLLDTMSTPCKGWSSFTSNATVLRAWPRMLYKKTLYSLQPPSEFFFFLSPPSIPPQYEVDTSCSAHPKYLKKHPYIVIPQIWSLAITITPLNPTPCSHANDPMRTQLQGCQYQLAQFVSSNHVTYAWR